MLSAIKGQLIVSCQALRDEPLYGSKIMGRMAYAAMLGGAKAIRANSIVDIREIKKSVQLPVIGIIKADYPSSDVIITPTEKEIDLLYEEGVDMIALDATNRIRPNGQTINEFFPSIRRRYPNQLFMADCSTFEEGLMATELGFDCIATTLSGYTNATKGKTLPDISLVKHLAKKLSIPIVAEGGIQTPKQLKQLFEVGAYSAVVGSAITRPLEITKRFVNEIAE
ncbi:N-acetylmannosamine-6-phosphate 2-epimerase [Halalkalibacter hemicellulosilyticus]|uniref:Putative N-acetylmannosamine-6-phosphate 2-epimerase n=1 Tax=Halalkalibacter hemicellulosilyticusJCM 9152 TaxID=1236971 RepID=W4QLJ6_9BACI|nr:N-acetylmannosamine-6-phosphate 2-epimerase [Halalkalibacter hemicellulosilyticus]GAE32508.1 N-acetylmannosamine-6-phosphate 2-epimerase [Halalkalibacter hemicellulosilyticusJCM 9152]